MREKVDSLALASLVDVLRDLPCYDEAERNGRFRMCRDCSERAIDAVAKFALIVMKVGGDPPIFHEKEGELEELPF